MAILLGATELALQFFDSASDLAKQLNYRLNRHSWPQYYLFEGRR